jgi:16S rRNA (adenine1518-N6/adenine1519-N6)-dimethyltransferase
VTLSRSAVVALLDQHGLAPRRALGQNFVADPNTVRRIARLAQVGPGDRVLEVGAGLGSLTLALAETGAAVTAVEIDRGLVPILREVVEPAGVRVVEGDAMVLDWPGLLGPGTWTMVANLPYNVATPLVLHLLDEVPAIGRMLVMVQREVAERLAAPPGSRTYGIPSVKVAYWATASVVGRVPASVFVPRPRVESALVRIVRHDRQPDELDPDRLFAVVRAGFGQRRKMLRRSLAGVLDATAIEAAGVDPSARAEDLGLDAWVALARAASAGP